MRQLREPAILFALYIAPGIAAITDSGVVTLSGGALAALVFRNAAFALLILYLLDIRGETSLVATWGIDRKRTAALVPNAVLVMVILLLAAGLTRLLFPVSAVPDAPMTRFAFDQPVYFRVPLIVTAILVVSFTEELFFRAYLLTRFHQAGAAPLVTIVTAATLFAIGHSWQGPEALVFSWVAGCILGVFWFRKPRLSVLVLGHAGYNIATLLISHV